ncbi:MAG TPA: cupin domain-containing protein [Phycisphaerae bacterium]|nr:cupin domain-containing protein [Phycisphaerae bacterium]HNU45087.1 cupin domain-containing protein [Phycisphaerae bacterium]
MAAASFPSLITDLPEADLPFSGLRAWILQGTERQAAFFDIDAIGDVAPHSHGEQWGVVIEGEMELTIEGRTQRLTRGDAYHIPAGAVHSARFRRRTLAIDVYADVQRFRPK